MFRLRLVELPMPTGSRDPDVLLAWLLDSMGLVRRRVEGGTIDEGQGALHRIISQAFLMEPLRGGMQNLFAKSQESHKLVCIINWLN